MNSLYYGDNLEVLRRHIPDASVDLVYLDPPFNSNKHYNILFAEQDGSRAASQIKAFDDTWRWDEAAALAYAETVEAGGQVSKALQAFRTLLGDSDMLAYLTMMAPRLVALRRVMKPTASIYLHCDPTASAHLRLLMDAVFGAANFRREIIWDIGVLSGFKTVANNWIRGHDAILFYSTGDAIFNKQRTAHRAEYIARFNKVDGSGRPYFDGRGERRYLDETLAKGKAIGDVWSDVMSFQQAPTSLERLGYPTQKPEALLERIILASSNEGDVVLDPFCGCGTTIAVAQRLKRRWIGIDVTHLAINLIKTRLRDAHGDAVRETYETIGEPTTVEDAAALAAEDPWQFQAWALGLVGARPAGPTKKGADQGVDGRLYFHDSPKGPTRQIVFSVKAGHLAAQFVRDLRGVAEREKAEIGVLISFADPTTAMHKEAASAGFYDSPWGKHPRLQLLTVASLLAGHGIDYPPSAQTNVTFRKGRRAKGEQPTTLPLNLEDEE